MFRKLHIQMTIFSTVITGIILIAMTLVCLFVAESGSKKTDFSTFTNNAHSCLTQLENQSLLSHRWLLSARSTYDMEIQIRDNGEPLFFDKLNPSGETQEIFNQVCEISRDTYALDSDNLKSVSVLSKTAIFKLDGYYACTALIPKTDSVLSVVILHPLDKLNDQLLRQRMIFAAAVLVSIGALTVFSWFFTRKMIRPLEESRRRQTEFIASASHELRSPLTVIQSNISAMEKADTAEAEHFRCVIQKEGNRMARLINDMLCLANADNHSWSFHTAPCELDTLLLENYEKYELLAQERRLHLGISLPDESLPPCLCDASRISQVLMILLDNALSYVPSGGQIMLSLSLDDKGFLLSVADNGPGISDQAKESVFERFYRADSARNDKQHFGLGLCIAKEIVELHHGTIRITDTPGGGATFLITLPV